MPYNNISIHFIQATCAMRELFAVEETTNLALTNFAPIWCTLFTRIASSCGVAAPVKVRVYVDDI